MGYRVNISCRPLVWLLAGLAATSAWGEFKPGAVLDSLRNLPDEQAEICVLGTFHFKDAGLDDYKPKFDIDVMSPERQKEIEETIQRLEKFAPTKIAIEVKRERQGNLDSSYSAYLRGEKELTSNEIHQIGYRLGKRLGMTKLYAVDAEAQSFYDDLMTQEQWEAARDSSTAYGLESDGWDARYTRLYASDDSAKQHYSIGENFRYLNSPERLIVGHGHYLIGTFQLGSEKGYFGPDSMIGWYVRNLRIFHNLIRITESPDERILLIIGAGHVPIINHAIEASPQYRLVPVSEVLGE